MTKYSKEVREEAARRAYAVDLDDPDWTADNIANDWIGRALCRAVADGLLHLDPVELDRARWEEAKRRFASQQGLTVDHFYRRLVREGWHPEPVDPVAEFCKAINVGPASDLGREIQAALDKLGLDIVKREAGQ